MNRLKEWFFIALKMELGRAITEKDIHDYFHDNCNCNRILVVRISIGKMSEQQEWDAHTLIKDFEQYKLINKK